MSKSSKFDPYEPKRIHANNPTAFVHVMNTMSETIEEESPRSGTRLDTWFGLSHASYIVAPRVQLQSMPAWWQNALAALMEMIPNTLVECEDDDANYAVFVRKEDGRIRTSNNRFYRHQTRDRKPLSLENA